MKDRIFALIASSSIIAATPAVAMETDSLQKENRSLCVRVNEKVDIQKNCTTPIIPISLQDLPEQLWVHTNIWKHIATFLHPRDVSTFQQSGKLVGFAFPEMLKSSICARIDPIKLKISFSQTIKHGDHEEKKGKATFLKSQECPYAKIELELCGATLNKLQKILTLCNNVFRLKLTHHKVVHINKAVMDPSDFYISHPDDNFLRAITASQAISTLEYLEIQTCKTFTDIGALCIVSSKLALPNLKHIYAEPYEKPEIFEIISKERPDLELTYIDMKKGFMHFSKRTHLNQGYPLTIKADGAVGKGCSNLSSIKLNDNHTITNEGSKDLRNHSSNL